MDETNGHKIPDAVLLENNPQQFLDDLKVVKRFLVFAKTTDDYFETSKKEVRLRASTKKLNYIISNTIYKSRIDCMVIC